MAEPWIAQNVDAVLHAWQAGQAQGSAVARTLLGLNNPAGRAAISTPVSAATLPAYYAHKVRGRGRGRARGRGRGRGRDRGTVKVFDLLAIHAVVGVGGLDRSVALAARLDRYLEQLVLGE